MDTRFTHFDRIYYGRKRNLSQVVARNHFYFFRAFLLMDSVSTEDSTFVEDSTIGEHSPPRVEDSTKADDDECPLCLDPLKSHVCIRTHCCEKMFHLDCYVRASLETCPLCRAPQPQILPVAITVLKTDWPRVTMSIGISLIVAACVSISVLLWK